MNGTEGSILVRLSAELSTKARGTRKRFTRKLVDNIRDALSDAGVRARVEDQWNRIFIHSGDAAAAEPLERIPGISSFSQVEAVCEAELASIVEAGRCTFREAVRGRSYAVRARRSGTHGFSSRDVQYALGAALNPGATVDLDEPEVEVEVEVRDRRAYLFANRTRGPGGLPLGVEGRALCLISGGFDSAAAAWLMLKRGVGLDYVFFNLAGDAYERSVVQVSKVLSDRWSYGDRPRLHVVEFGAAVDELRARTNPRFWQLVLKRLMYRAASRVADENGASAIVTGESIGQVSSQTLANLAALEGASDRPVFRPLLGFDKAEIIELTRALGTFDLSAKVKEYCAIAPGNPVTSASPAAAAAEEERVDADVVRRIVEERRVLDLRAINAADLVNDYLFTERVPDDAVVVDVRSETEWEEWHYPGAERRDYWELAENLRSLDPDRVYVLYCDAGSQAAFLAERLQRGGVEAYALRGGTAALRASTGTKG